MAEVYHPSYTVPFPPDVTVLRRFRKKLTTKGKPVPVARMRWPDGKKEVVRTNKAGDKLLRFSRTWWIRLYLPDGTRPKFKGYRDRKATENEAAELERRAIRIHAGLIDPMDVHAKTPLREHLADYIRDLNAKGRCDEHVNKTEARIKTIIDGCGFVFARDLNAEKVAALLHELRQDRPRLTLAPDQFWFTPREMVAALGGKRPAKLGRFLRRERLEVKGTGKAGSTPGRPWKPCKISSAAASGFPPATATWPRSRLSPAG
jgi:hypothetical protein